MIKKATEKCKQKLQEYYNKTNKVYIVATGLDPRFKMQYYRDYGWNEFIDEIQESKYIYIYFLTLAQPCFI